MCACVCRVEYNLLVYKRVSEHTPDLDRQLGHTYPLLLASFPFLLFHFNILLLLIPPWTITHECHGPLKEKVRAISCFILHQSPPPPTHTPAATLQPLLCSCLFKFIYFDLFCPHHVSSFFLTLRRNQPENDVLSCHNVQQRH